MQIYPTAFNPCILHCYKDSFGENVCSLFQENTNDTSFLSLAFNEKTFDGSLFYCDLMEAKDSGYPFLTITNVFQLNGQDITNESYLVRLSLIETILQDPNFFVYSVNNEYRVKSLTLFELHDIQEVLINILPNFHGFVYGINFISDEPKIKVLNSEKDNEFLVRKTRFPDVFEIFNDSGLTPVSPNNVLYLNTLSISQKLNNLLKNRNSTMIKCNFNENRKKWEPIL